MFLLLLSATSVNIWDKEGVYSEMVQGTYNERAATNARKCGKYTTKKKRCMRVPVVVGVASEVLEFLQQIVYTSLD